MKSLFQFIQSLRSRYLCLKESWQSEGSDDYRFYRFKQALRPLFGDPRDEATTSMRN
jgi:hypothetical protein